MHFIHKIRLSGATASITVVHIRKFFRMRHDVVDSESFLE